MNGNKSSEGAIYSEHRVGVYGGHVNKLDRSSIRLAGERGGGGRCNTNYIYIIARRLQFTNCSAIFRNVFLIINVSYAVIIITFFLFLTSVVSIMLKTVPTPYEL